MKNILIILLALVISAPLFGQTRVINRFYNKYKHEENVTNIKVKGWLLKMAGNFADDETAEKMLKKITQLRVLVIEGQDKVAKKDYTKLVEDVKKKDFEEILRMRDGLTSIRALVKSNGDDISNVLLLIDGEDEFIMLSLEGNLKFSDLKSLNFDVDGGDAFEHLPETKPKA